MLAGGTRRRFDRDGENLASEIELERMIAAS
jgi:hypothetical protein